MSNRKLLQSLGNLEKGRLEEALAEDLSNSLLVDGTIQRFEFTIELYWKTLKQILDSEGIETKTPRETLKEAYQIGWINDEIAWLQMLKDRIETSHTNDEEATLRILRNIKEYFPRNEVHTQDLTKKSRQLKCLHLT